MESEKKIMIAKGAFQSLGLRSEDYTLQGMIEARGTYENGWERTFGSAEKIDIGDCVSSAREELEKIATRKGCDLMCNLTITFGKEDIESEFHRDFLSNYSSGYKRRTVSWHASADAYTKNKMIEDEMVI